MAHLIPKLTWTDSLGNSHEIIFRYPPKDDNGEQLKSDDEKSKALDGSQWTILNFIEAKRSVTLSFLNELEREALIEFFVTWAGRGKSFEWFPDFELPDFKTYELEKSDLIFRKVVPKDGGFIWETTLSFRRAI